jgi:hypothetical protein
VDTQKAASPVRRWLALSLAVLLAHLGVLQSMPLALYPGSHLTDPAMTFATRTIVAPPLLEPTPLTPTAVVSAKPRVVRPAKAPAEPSPPAIAPVPAAASEGSTSAGWGGDSELLAAAASPASAPEPAAPPEAKEVPPATRPPREKAPSFRAESLSGSSKLLYRVSANRFPFNLNAELVWRNRGDGYSARLSYSAFGQSRSQTSRGQISDVGLAPERFSDKYRTEVAAHFNRAEGKVSFSANTPEAPLLIGAQDRLSVLIQLGALVASEPERYGPGTTLTIQTVGPRDADLWLFTIEATETLELPGGTLQGVKLVRNPRQAFDQKVEVWLAPQLGYLPARIRITETNGDAIDQQWSASEAPGEAD